MVENENDLSLDGKKNKFLFYNDQSMKIIIES